MPATLHVRDSELSPNAKAGITITILACLTLLLFPFLLFSYKPSLNPLTHYRTHLLAKRQQSAAAEEATRTTAQETRLHAPKDTRPFTIGNYGNPNWKRNTYGDGVAVRPHVVVDGGEEGLFVVGDGEGDDDASMRERGHEGVRGNTYNPFEKQDEDEGRGRTRERGFGHGPGRGSPGRAV